MPPIFAEGPPGQKSLERLCGAGWAAFLAHPLLARETVAAARSVQVSQVPVGAAAITDNN